MDSLILYIIIAAAAFWAGWHIRTVLILAHLAAQPEKMIKILEQIRNINEREAAGVSTELKEQTGDELRIERVGEVLYAYTKQNDEFIAQGPDLASLLSTAHARYPNRVFFGTIDANDSAKDLAIKN